MRSPRLLRLILAGSVLLALLLVQLSSVPRAFASSQDQISSTEVQVTSDTTWVDAVTLDKEQYTCPSNYPHLVNWKDNSSGGGTYSEWSSGGSGSSDDPDWVKVLFGGGALTIGHTGVNAGIIYICSADWFPTTADCGGEGQPDCWGAIQGYLPGTPQQGWMRSDPMFYANGTGLCDHGLIGGTDYTCQNITRHQLSSEGHGGSWETWALDQQAYNLAANEPMNWISRPRTHESYNTEADGNAIPNHVYSLSDQLDAGIRSLDLRPRWGIGNNPYLRLSHGTNSCTGCSGLDRPYTYAILEIAQWLYNNPDQVIFMDLAQYDGGDTRHEYITDPIQRYMGSKVLTPREWCDYLEGLSQKDGTPAQDCSGIPNNSAGNAWQPYRWPTIAEMKSMGKQIIIKDRQAISGWDSSVTFGADLEKDTNSFDPFARSFVPSTCSRGTEPYTISAMGKDAFYESWSDVGEARVTGEATFAHDQWPGYIYAYTSDIPSSGTSADQIRPYANQATSVEAVVNCNLTPTFDMFRADSNFNGVGNSVTTDPNVNHDRRDPLIWTWANGDYGQPNSCALLENFDQRFHSVNCGNAAHVACAQETTPGSGQFRVGDPYNWQDPMGQNWKVTANTYSWQDAAQGCANEFTGYVFAVPKSKYQEIQLQNNNPNKYDVWLSYTDKTTDSKWHVAAPPAITSAGPFWVARGNSVPLTAVAHSPTGSTVSFKWDLADTGTFSDLGPNPTYVSASSELTHVALVHVKAIDANGIESASVPVYVFVTPNGTPINHFAAAQNTDPNSSAVATNYAGNVTANGVGTVLTAQYTADPIDSSGIPPFEHPGSFFNATAILGSTFSAVTILDCDLGAGNFAYWYDVISSAWTRVSNQTYDSIDHCLTITINNSTSPSLRDLTGTVFGTSKDVTAPTTTAALTVAGSPYDGSWKNKTVDVNLLATDDTGGSGVAATYYSINGGNPVAGTTAQFTSDGIYTLAYWSVDYAGNVENQNTATIKVDKTKPIIMHTLSPSPNQAGWNNTNTKVTFSCADPLTNGVYSGVASCVVDGSSPPSDNTTLTTEGINLLVSGTATDVAGNSAADSATLKIDKTPPTISHTQFPAPNTAGWNKGDVTLTYTCSDPISNNIASGLASCVGGGTSPASNIAVVVAEGSSVQNTGTATDIAGNVTTDPVVLKIDKTPPTIIGTPDRQPNADGWYHAPVTVTFTCDDLPHGTASGVKVCPLPVTLSTDGANQQATGRAIDVAANTADATTDPINIDQTPPQISVDTGGYSPGAWSTAPVTVTFSCTDTGGSGVKSLTAPSTFSTDGTAQSITGTCVDKAGNQSQITASDINIDQTPPTITGSIPGTGPINGWYNSTVTVHFACSDAASGVASCAPDKAFNTEGPGFHVTGNATDVAGNSASTQPISFSIDKTAPSTTASTVPTWSAIPVTVKFTATDALSGVAATYYKVDNETQQTGTSATISADGSHTLHYWSIDKAGNSETAHTLTVQIDSGGPVITPQFSPSSPATTGWYTIATGSPSVTFNCTDALSGVAPGSCPGKHSFTDGSSQTVTVSATDVAGNTTKLTTDPIKVDTVRPNITASATVGGKPYTAGSWTNQPVTVHFTCGDTGSGIATTDGCPSDQFFPADGAGQQAQGTAIDTAGNSTDVTFKPINIATGTPSTTASPNPLPNSAGWNNGNVTVRLLATAASVKGGTGPAIASITYSASGAQTIHQTVVKANSATLPIITTTGTTTITYFATDTAGTIENPETLVVQIDKTKPTITATTATKDGKTYTPGTWTDQLVTVTFHCSAGVSGLPDSACPLPVTLSKEGQSQLATGTVTNVAGTKGTVVVQNIDIDLTAPTSSASVAPMPNGRGVNTTAPTVTLSARDPQLAPNVNGSGVASITYSATGAQTIAQTVARGSRATIAITHTGKTTITYWGTDVAGNAEGPIHNLIVNFARPH